jgi:hypothetical protein
MSAITYFLIGVGCLALGGTIFILFIFHVISKSEEQDEQIRDQLKANPYEE